MKVNAVQGILGGGVAPAFQPSAAMDVEKMTAPDKENDLAAVARMMLQRKQQNQQAMSPGAPAGIDSALLAALGKNKGV